MKAEDLILAAQTSLLWDHPFFGVLMLQMKKVDATDDPRIDTMATDGRHLYYHRPFVESMKKDELIFVLAHEVMHNALEHHIRRQHRKPGRWNVACVTEGTLVTMADGTVRPIETINGGDKISSPAGVGSVHIVVENTKQEIVEIETDCGAVLRCGVDHEVLTSAGFIKAGAIKEGAACFVDAGFAGRDRAHGADINDLGIGRGDRADLSAGGKHPDEEGPLQGSPVHPGKEADPRLNVHGNADGVPCRDSGRGRNGLDPTTGPEGRGLLPPARRHINDRPALSRVAGGERVPRFTTEELQWSRVLEMCDIRLLSGWVVSADASIFGDQEAARRAIDQLHSGAATARRAIEVDAAHGEFVRADQVVKCARVKAVRRVSGGAPVKVFDLVTTCHSFFANGVATHNCDYAINGELVECNVGKMPDCGLISSAFTGLSAEEIYRILDEQNNGDDSDEDSMDGGGCGGVIDGCAPHDEAAKAELRAEMQTQIRQAAMTARAAQAGKMPAGIERIIQELLKPKVDWRSVLRRFIDESSTRDFSWAKPNRRLLPLGYITPGTVSDGVSHIVIAVDTSGSIDAEILRDFAAEINGAFNEGAVDRLTVIYADATVRNVEEFETGDELVLHPAGGGGTAFSDTFALIAEKYPDARATIYLTDLLVSDFGEEPPHPVLWGVYGDPRQFDQLAGNVPWGEPISISVQ